MYTCLDEKLMTVNVTSVKKERTAQASSRYCSLVARVRFRSCMHRLSDSTLADLVLILRITMNSLGQARAA